MARRLVPVLNEPLLWLGSEVHAVLAKLDDTLALGIDERGLIAASPVLARDDNGQRHCPVLGPVHAVAHVGALYHRIAAPPPWLHAPPRGGALVSIGGRRVWLQGSGYVGQGGGDSDVKITELGDARVPFHLHGTRETPVLELDNDELSVGDRRRMHGVDVVVRAVVPALDGLRVPLSATVHGRTSLAVGEANRVRAGLPEGGVSGHVVNLGEGKLGVVGDAHGGCPAIAYVVDAPAPLDASNAPLRWYGHRTR